MRIRKGLHRVAAPAALALLVAGCGPKEKGPDLSTAEMEAEGVQTEANVVPETSLTDLRSGNIIVDDGSGTSSTVAPAPSTTPPADAPPAEPVETNH